MAGRAPETRMQPNQPISWVWLLFLAMAGPSCVGLPTVDPATDPAIEVGDRTTGLPQRPDRRDRDQAEIEFRELIQVHGDGTWTINVHDEDLFDVLDDFSTKAEKSMVTRYREHRISVDVDKVSFDQALDSILRPCGYGALVEDDWIYLLTLEELDAARQED